MIPILTEKQLEWQQQIRELAQTKVKPIAIEIDKTHRFPVEYFDIFKTYNLMGMAIPEEYGGTGMDLVPYAMAIEELSKVCAVSGSMVQTHNAVGMWPIYRFGSDYLKEKYLPLLSDGYHLAAFCLTEANAGSDAAGVQTTAKDMGDHWLLSGSKLFITGGSIADTYIVTAMTDKAKKVKGISAFVVEKDFPGLSFGKQENKMGLRGSATAEVILDNVVVPKENLLGEQGKGFKVAMTGLDFGRVGVAAQSIGIAQGAFEELIRYYKEEANFNPTESQAIAFDLGKMKTHIEAGRMLLYRAAYMRQVQHPDYSIAAAEAKLFCSELAMHISSKAVTYMGWRGYTTDYTLERMMRDAKITEIYEGTSEIQELVISNKLFQ